MSCADVQTIQAGNGTKTQFSFDFPYIFKSEIHVYFWNATTKEWDEKLTTDSTYPWQVTDANPTIVEFTSTAPPAPATPVDPGETSVDNVKIRRITNVDDIRALFNPGSAIRSDDLNNNFEQLRYAIQEANCQGIPDDVDQYLKDYYWDRFDNTLYSADTWRSDDATIATTAALDQRFQDEVNDTFTKSELAAASLLMPDNDNAVPTTGAVNDYINEVITNDIGTDGTGITVTDDGDGTITLGLADNTIDFDKIKDADQIKLADQVANYQVAGSDDKVFTASAAIRRFENYVQNSSPSPTAGVGKGAVWVDPDDDLTLSVWNGSAWLGITSGGTFTNQPKVVYVDASSGDDSNDGHRISRPKATIKAAVNQINSDSTYGDGSVVIVAAGVYQEAAPIQIQKKNVSIIGQALRSCIVHPTTATETNTLFELNSGSYIANLTLTGMKAGTGTGNSVDATLPTTQGWNFAFYSNATITKSPYIQNCTNFSDSEIDNDNLNAVNPAGGSAGDTDSAPTGGGLLVDGSVVNSASPLRSMVCDSYTHVGLNGPGILVTNNGYVQATSSYAFFNKYHIKCLNGGQANLAASTTDFGDQALVADGKSTTAIFTSNVDGAANSGAISFNINQPTAGSGWYGDTERPATNMLVEVNGIIYPILSATANTDSEGGAGWTVTISRPNPNNRSENLGLNGAISDDAAVSFYLRSMIASSGHTMEYVGSGTDYRALPENGGVPDETKQITESNNGKVWTAVTDHNGKFKIGGNQTTDPIFEVDQQRGFVTIPEGSIAFNLLSDLTPQLGGDLDVNGNTITGLPATPTSSTEATSKAYVDAQIAGIDEVVEDTTPQLGGNLDVNGNEITSASNGNVVINPNGTGTISLGADTSVTGDLTVDTNVLHVDASADAVGVGTTSPHEIITARGNIFLEANSTAADSGQAIFWQSTTSGWNDAQAHAAIYGRRVDANNGYLRFDTRSGGTTAERARIDSNGIFTLGNGTLNGVSLNPGTTNSPLVRDSAGRVGIGTSSPDQLLHLRSSSTPVIRFEKNDDTITAGEVFGAIEFESIDASAGSAGVLGKIECFAPNILDGTTTNGGALRFFTSTINPISLTERMRIDQSGNVGIGTTSPSFKTEIVDTLQADANLSYSLVVRGDDGGTTGESAQILLSAINATTRGAVIAAVLKSGSNDHDLVFKTSAASATPSERVRIDSSGRLLVGATIARTAWHNGTIASNLIQIERAGVGSDASISLCANSGTSSTSISAAQVLLGKTRGSAVGATDAVANDDCLGRVSFQGSDGTQQVEAAKIEAFVDGTSGANNMPGRLVFSTTSSGLSSSTERVRITSTGRLICGRDARDATLESTDQFVIEGNGYSAFHALNTTAYTIGQNSNSRALRIGSGSGWATTGVNLAAGGTSWGTYSDERLKTDIVELSDCLDSIKDVRCISYRLTDVDTAESKKRLGIIAQDLVGKYDEAINQSRRSDDDNTEYLSVQYTDLVPVLIKALQEASSKIETLEARLTALESA